MGSHLIVGIPVCVDLYYGEGPLSSVNGLGDAAAVKTDSRRVDYKLEMGFTFLLGQNEQLDSVIIPERGVA